MSVHFALSYMTYLMTDIYVYLCYSSKPPVPSNVLSMTQLKTMDLPDQVKALLINGELSLAQPSSSNSSVHYIIQSGAWKVLCFIFYFQKACVAFPGGLQNMFSKLNHSVIVLDV